MEIFSHSDLSRLFAALQDIGDNGCEVVGLLPMSPLRHSGYAAAPRNSIAFAGTGGDGVHFSLLTQENVDPTLWPVVMTVPMAFHQANLIVGSDLREFLGLGLRHGYFGLEQLVYDRDEAIALLDGDVEAAQRLPVKFRALAAIREAFGIRPWEDHGKRIAELQAAFPLD